MFPQEVRHFWRPGTPRVCAWGELLLSETVLILVLISEEGEGGREGERGKERGRKGGKGEERRRKGGGKEEGRRREGGGKEEGRRREGGEEGKRRRRRRGGEEEGEEREGRRGNKGKGRRDGDNRKEATGRERIIKANQSCYLLKKITLLILGWLMAPICNAVYPSVSFLFTFTT